MSLTVIHVRALAATGALVCAFLSLPARADKLRITTVPPGATVQINGVLVGTTPYEQGIPGGYLHKTRTALGSRLGYLMVARLTLEGYKETDSWLHDADKNRLFGSEHYKSGRLIVRPSPWAEGDFEEKMSALRSLAKVLNRSVPAFKEAQTLLEDEDSVIGQIIRRSKRPG